ncbi:MAG: hypothetical protein R3D84_06675 [Paracoccaceae bacterium]
MAIAELHAMANKIMSQLGCTELGFGTRRSSRVVSVSGSCWCRHSTGCCSALFGRGMDGAP